MVNKELVNSQPSPILHLLLLFFLFFFFFRKKHFHQTQVHSTTKNHLQIQLHYPPDHMKGLSVTICRTDNELHPNDITKAPQQYITLHGLVQSTCLNQIPRPHQCGTLLCTKRPLSFGHSNQCS